MEHDHRERLTGDFTVSGAGTLTVELTRSASPKTVVVAFAHHHHHPCNPNMHQDILDWELKSTDYDYTHLLIITYDVGEAERVIIFSATY